ncbi:glycerophosphodiester phosphodiesterase family protein [soil metagenome]
MSSIYNDLPAPLILGHRGAPAEAPENTLRAFRLALEHGADGVELDVQPSADGVPVVIHDATLERTTGSRGAVAALPWSALRELRAGGEPIPCLEEVADWAAASGAWLNVELKAVGAEAASLAALAQAGVLERTLFSSFLPEVVAEVGRLAPEARRYLLTERWDANLREIAAEVEAGGICLENRAVTPQALHELAAARLPVVVWTVDEPARIEALLHAGVAALITNFPARGVAARRALAQGLPPQ